MFDFTSLKISLRHIEMRMSKGLRGQHFQLGSIICGAFFFWSCFIHGFSQPRKFLSIRNFYEPRNFDQMNNVKYFHHAIPVLWYIWINIFIQIYHSKELSLEGVWGPGRFTQEKASPSTWLHSQVIYLRKK